MKLLKFSAPWCQPCQRLNEGLKGIKLPYPLEEIDIDQHPEVGAKFRIRSVPTICIVDDEGNEFARKVGEITPKRLLEWIGEATRDLKQ